jgi:hypothetical protein
LEEEDDDMAVDDSIEMHHQDSSMSKSLVVVKSPARDKMTSCAPTRQGAERANDKVIHRRVVAAPRSSPFGGSFFQRKLAQLREGQMAEEEEKKEVAKLEGESLSKNDAGTAATMALGDTASSVTETSSAMTSEAVTSASSAKMTTTSSSTVIAASTSTLSASSSVGSSSVTSSSTVTSSSSVMSTSQLVAEKEEECGIDMGELIPNLENFDPAILDILPPRFRYRTK